MIQKGLIEQVSIVEEDSFMQYIWVQITSFNGCITMQLGVTFHIMFLTVNFSKQRLKPSLCQTERGYYEGNIIVLGDMNACTQFLPGSLQEFDLSHTHRRVQDMVMYTRNTCNKKELDHYKKCLLDMCNSTKMLIANRRPHQKGT